MRGKLKIYANLWNETLQMYEQGALLDEAEGEFSSDENGWCFKVLDPKGITLTEGRYYISVPEAAEEV